MRAMPNINSPTEDEIAAALAAIQHLLHDPPADAQADRAGWHDSSRLVILGLRPTRIYVRPSWRTIERLRRGSSSGFTGMTGM